ncbi:hypothetical protein FNI11_05945 [Salmonella enterica subsp. salamae]|nr:hypothetical protein [Salmonella enterica subsp. salamae]ECJ2280457.1 hypothetical protein [Salmonella enterica subsp. salamae]
MPFHVGSGCLPATITHRRISRIAQSDTPPEMTLWEKVKELYCSTHQTEALECIRKICHPPAGTTREALISRFEQLRALAYAGCEDNIQSGRHGENHFCILDAHGQEMLSVTLDDAGGYTVKCRGYHETHHLIMDTEQGGDCTDHAERAFFFRAATVPQTAKAYDAVWSKWERAAPARELSGRAAAVQEMRACLNNRNPILHLRELGLTTLPEHLPPHIISLIIDHNNYLTRLPALPRGLQSLTFAGNLLTCLPTLPSGLKSLWVLESQLTRLPVLPSGLREIMVSCNQLSSLPELPPGLERLWAFDNQLTSLPTLPPGLRVLGVCGNWLTRLPESIFGLSSYACVNLKGNPLYEHTLQTLQDITSAPDYSGPTIQFDMADPSVQREPRGTAPGGR